MSDFLVAMASSSRARADELLTTNNRTTLESQAGYAAPPKALVLSVDGFDLIAETKLASPADGRLVAKGDSTRQVLDLAAQFQGSGACALSVLTAPQGFEGHIDHLRAVASSSTIPVMRKDFLVDPIQILEARAAEASGVLLIARMMSRGLLDEMTDLAISLGMFALVEIFESRDLEVASAVFDRDILLGVNARDLSTLQVDPDEHSRLVSELPPHLTKVAESGISDSSDVTRVAGQGFRLALVGKALVSSANPSRLATEMLKAGRATTPLKARK